MKLYLWIFSLLFAALSANTLAQSTADSDYIVALVNSEPITNAELELQIDQIIENRNRQNLALPPASELRAGVLDRMINERAQLQLAKGNGIRVDATAVDQAEADIAAQNQIDVAQLRANLEKRGKSLTGFRQQLRDQILITRLQEREVDARLKVTDSEVEAALAARQLAAKDPLNQEINLGHLFIALPENAGPGVIAQVQEVTRKILARLDSGESFEALVKELSAAERNNGGQLGLRRADRYPPLFVTATQTLAVGAVSQWVRSDAGFHLLKLIDRRVNGLSDTMVQHHGRHILLRPDASLTQDQAIARLAQARESILNGSTRFEVQAQAISQDSSAAQGGDLGWATPGMFVPEFEQVLNNLKEGEIAMPIVSRFGVHLIQLLERRTIALTTAQLRDRERNLLRGKRADEIFETWSREVRDRAFVEIRDLGK